MSLLDDALEAEASAGDPRAGCWFAKLDPEDQASLNRRFATKMTTSAIGRAIRASKVAGVNDGTVSKHRKGTCSCPR